MGVVYEATQKSLGRTVALKLMSSTQINNASPEERFRREARAAARLHHTNIVPVFDIGTADGTCYYTMPFIKGKGQDQLIARSRFIAILDGPGA